MHTYRLLLFTLLLTSPLLVRAQSNNPVGGHFGFKVGASLTRLSISGPTVNIPKQSLQPNIGVMYRYRLQKFVIQPEVLLAIKGATLQSENTNAATRNTTPNSYYYVSVPIMLGYIPTEGLTVQAGPEFSYALNSGKPRGPGVNNDIGLAVGVHYDFLDMLDKMSLHVRYVQGFVDVSPEPGAIYRNQVVQVSVVYNLYKKRKKL